MKKIISILILTILMVLTLSACGVGKPKIEDYEFYDNDSDDEYDDNEEDV